MPSLRSSSCALIALGLAALATSCAKGNDLGSGGSGGDASTSTSQSTGTSSGDICGNDKIAGQETCDDGNTDGGDGCSAVCMTEVGFTCSGTPSVCVTTCGDGVTVGAETCDDGNVKPYDGCDANCKIETGFDCVGAPSVCTATCGDGQILGAETCDDGNKMAGDGCSATCKIETGFTCTGTPSVCKTTCGDGVVGGAETCDDGNVKTGDGCDASCLVENGYTCMGAPSVCATTCGDGIVAGSEGCDDHNTAPGDGCGATCLVETGYACMGSPSVCTKLCGNGILDPGEQCDDGNTNDADACTNSCLKGLLVIGGNSTTAITAALATLGETYLVDSGSQWGTPSDVGVIILGNDGGGQPYPDYTNHVNAGAHVLSIGGSQDSGGFTGWIGNYLTTDGTSNWHQSDMCTFDWTRTTSTGIAQFMPSTFEFATLSPTYHMVHLSNTQPSGTTLYGQTCDNPSAPNLLASRRYPTGGTFTMMALDLGNFASPANDAQAQTNFLVPFLKGYLLSVRSP